MNPQKEFVKAIMSVLRLEQNIYTVASIEEIVDRIDVSDYTIFIAYLGERSSDFERPIQTIAKATDDFHSKKTTPKVLAVTENIQETLKSINKLMSEYLKKETGYTNEYELAKSHANDNGMFSDMEQAKEAQESSEKIFDNARKDIFSKLRNKDQEFFDSIDIQGDKLSVDLETMKRYGFTIADLLNGIPIKNEIIKQICKPSIIDKISNTAMSDATNSTAIESNRVKALMAKASSPYCS